MNWSNRFILLDKSVHDRASFDCGEAELNDFIQHRAVRHMESGVSTTMVLPGSDPLPDGRYPICAFYTITPGSIAKETLPAPVKKKLPYYPVPVFLIAQLAVYNDCKAKGLGKITLVNALKYLWDINQLLKAYAVIVDCLNHDVQTFYERYGFTTLGEINGKMRLFLPMKTVGMLFQ